MKRIVSTVLMVSALALAGVPATARRRLSMSQRIVRLTCALVLAAVAAPATPSSAGEPRADWKPLCGRVNAIDRGAGNLVLATDGGRRVTVDAAAIDRERLSSVRVGERVIVLAVRDPEPHHFVARFLRSDTESATGPANTWTCVHGYILGESGVRLEFRADSGRVATVDLSGLGADMPKTFVRGERLTVIGELGGARGPLSARFVQRDRSEDQ